MKHKTWFRLVVRAIGLLVMALSVGHVVNTLVVYGGQLIMRGSITWEAWLFGYGIGQVASFLIGLYLFLGGEWIVNLAIPSNRPYCPECGYDLTHNPGLQCSECGVALPSATGKVDD